MTKTTKEAIAERSKNYYLANKEALAERSKEYREANKEALAERSKEYREANKEAKAEQNKKYREANKEAIADYRKEYNEANPDYQKKYYQANRESINEFRRTYTKDRRATNPAFKLIANLRIRHRQVLKGKASTTKGLGCDSNFLREHVENQWVIGMTWNNYGIKEGQWSLDHRLPLSLYYTNPELLPQLIHYSNMQPMWHVENIKKGNKI